MIDHYLLDFLCFQFRAHVQVTLARTTQPVKPVLQKEVTDVCASLVLLVMSVESVSTT